jgi:hypothetical protein
MDSWERSGEDEVWGIREDDARYGRRTVGIRESTALLTVKYRYRMYNEVIYPIPI